MFFILCDNYKTLFSIQFYLYLEVLFNRHVLAFFEASDLKEVHTMQHNTILMPKFQNEALVYHTCVSYFLTIFIFWGSTSFFKFFIHFFSSFFVFYLHYFLFEKTSLEACFFNTIFMVLQIVCKKWEITEHLVPIETIITQMF